MTQNVTDVIRSRYGKLTKKQRLTADIMLADPESMAFMTLRDLAAAAGVSEMTVLHTCAALGFENYNQLKYEFRRYLTLKAKVDIQEQCGYPNMEVPSYELSEPAKLMAQICDEEAQVSRGFFESVGPVSLLHAAEMIVESRVTLMAARGVSMQVADFLSMRLAIMGLPAVVMNTEQNDSLHAALPLLGKGVALIAISMPDYYIMTTKVCEFARRQGASILGLTDHLKAPIAQYCDLLLTAPTATRLFINTIGPMLSLANLLSAAVNILKSRHAGKKFDAPVQFSKLFSGDAE
ncbi:MULTISPECIES: MurR/RpiR family transcriptional regulator [Jonquetella]|uniref:Transcriptional regulator n=1 Tax=Jonquetella anthropi DSM 22815 TaxID=885272 RepID=H0UMD1_9BACT|nr:MULTISPECIES: MurR/RpiR family transcriptional regulator [Jonquetella]EEX47630.1 SIS domain protein [Jonquetella anthropi E3_33 E1]EHM12604.1 transcriptional regulator [Jonquetella anthropi DSM 22815]